LTQQGTDTLGILRVQGTLIQSTRIQTPCLLQKSAGVRSPHIRTRSGTARGRADGGASRADSATACATCQRDSGPSTDGFFFVRGAIRLGSSQRRHASDRVVSSKVGLIAVAGALVLEADTTQDEASKRTASGCLGRPLRQEIAPAAL
jgi:hypothetical protein